MSPAARAISPALARQLAITKQHLGAERPASDMEGLYAMTRDLGCLQLDPTSAVARSHLLVVWSRAGQYDPAHLDRLLWDERRLFEYWAHAASIVLTEDYPIHAYRMRRHRQGENPWSRHLHQWAAENAGLRDHILSEIRERGPLPSEHFEDKAQGGWKSSGWTGNRNVGQMLTHLWTSGDIMVAGRKGNNRYWDLSDRFLPAWTPRDPLDDEGMVYRAAQRSLKALGVARLKHISEHFTRGRYPNLSEMLTRLEQEGKIQPVQIVEDGKVWPGPWYVHSDDLPLLDRLEAGGFAPRTTLLSPFDNLICDRARTEKLFNFYFRIEIYVPKPKRQYGYYVLPILHGDRLIGRIDPLMNRKAKRLEVNNVYAEPDAPMDAATGQAVAGAIQEMAAFLGAESIAYGENVPGGWKPALKAMS
jgi:uncharacterized protein YcaQ